MCHMCMESVNAALKPDLRSCLPGLGFDLATLLSPIASATKASTLWGLPSFGKAQASEECGGQALAPPALQRQVATHNNRLACNTTIGSCIPSTCFAHNNYVIVMHNDHGGSSRMDWTVLSPAYRSLMVCQSFQRLQEQRWVALLAQGW